MEKMINLIIRLILALFIASVSFLIFSPVLQDAKVWDALGCTNQQCDSIKTILKSSPFIMFGVIGTIIVLFIISPIYDEDEDYMEVGQSDSNDDIPKTFTSDGGSGGGGINTPSIKWSQEATKLHSPEYDLNKTRIRFSPPEDLV